MSTEETTPGPTLPQQDPPPGADPGLTSPPNEGGTNTPPPDEGAPEKTKPTTKVEYLQELTKDDLQALADENEVDYSKSATKAEMVEHLAESRKVTRADAKARYEAKQTGQDAGAVGTPGGPGFADATNVGDQALDRDVRDVPKAERPQDEYEAPLNAETWVRLGEHENVPEWAVGHIAAVLHYPTEREYDASTDTLVEKLPKDAWVTVRERAQGATFHIPLSSVQEIVRGGRAEILTHP